MKMIFKLFLSEKRRENHFLQLKLEIEVKFY